MSIQQKIFSIMREAEVVRDDQELDGVQWVSEAAINDVIRPLMVKHGVIAYVSDTEVMDAGRMPFMKVWFTFVDIELPESQLTVKVVQKMDDSFTATGAAITTAIKHALKTTFRLSTNEDTAGAVIEKKIQDVSPVSPADLKMSLDERGSDLKAAPEKLEEIKAMEAEGTLPKPVKKAGRPPKVKNPLEDIPEPVVEAPKVEVKVEEPKTLVLSDGFDIETFEEELEELDKEALYEHEYLKFMPVDLKELFDTSGKNKSARSYRTLIMAFVKDVFNDQKEFDGFYQAIRDVFPPVVPEKTWKKVIEVPALGVQVGMSVPARTTVECTKMLHELRTVHDIRDADFLEAIGAGFRSGAIKKIYGAPDKPGVPNVMQFLRVGTEDEILTVLNIIN